MGATKTDHFTDKQNELAVLCKAMGHPARVAILEYLLKNQECICGDIVDFLPLAQPTVSQHLKELKQAGLIQGSIEGNSICYCIDQNAIKKLERYFTSFFNTLKTTKKTCC